MKQTALIVHELMGNPDGWREAGDSITNGYYTVALNGSRYGMGASAYQADGTERDSLNRALDCWKKETGWQPAEKPATMDKEPTRRGAMAPDLFIREAYEKFARSIRSNHRSFIMHGDSSVLSCSIQEAISALDLVLRPMEKIEGKRSDAPEAGTSSS